MATDPAIKADQTARTVPEVMILTAEGAALLDASTTARHVGQVGQFEFSEGPTWLPRHSAWVFSDIPADTQYVYREEGEGGAGGSLQIFRKPSAKANGNFLDNEGRLLTCEHGSRLLTRCSLPAPDADLALAGGSSAAAPAPAPGRSVLASAFGGQRLTSPNDVVVSRQHGDIYFTDPTYGTIDAIGHGDQSEQASNGVYRLDADTGVVTALDESFLQPNGLCFSPDEALLYVADSGAYSPTPEGCPYVAANPHHVRVFDVVEGGKALENGRVFCTTAEGNGVPDGIRCDAAGNLWVSVAEGVNVYSGASGEEIAKIKTPETVANAAFGGPDGTDLMMCSCTSVWLLRTKVKGSGDLGPAA